ncbi:MAG: TatD family hydrolase [Bdellovibrionales bacterium]|nr:TatD family hydrolase [Bdellovibrionales bacterium]
MSLIDSHAHLDFESFDSDRQEILDRAFSAGVEIILNICLGPEKQKLDKAVEMTNLDSRIFAAVGIHPHDASKVGTTGSDLIKPYLSYNRVIAVGEIGLDYYYQNSEKKDQLRVFDEMLDLALETKCPVSIHTRDAFEDTYELLKTKQIFKNIGGIIHCFTGNAEQAKKFLNLGAMISFSGVLTFKNAHQVIEAAQIVPIDRVLIETDAPFLAPIPHRGKRNEPSFVKLVAERLAMLHQIEPDVLGVSLIKNMQTLFGNRI